MSGERVQRECDQVRSHKEARCVYAFKTQWDYIVFLHIADIAGIAYEMRALSLAAELAKLRRHPRSYAKDTNLGNPRVSWDGLANGFHPACSLGPSRWHVKFYHCVWNFWTEVKPLLILLLLLSQLSDFSRGTWHAIRDHVQQSYLIAWDREPDQLCVPAPFSNLHAKRPSQ